MPTAPAPGFAALGLRQPEDLKRMGANSVPHSCSLIAPNQTSTRAFAVRGKDHPFEAIGITISVNAAYIAGLCDHRDVLVKGEKGILLCVAPDMRVAGIVRDHCAAAFENSPILRQLIANRTQDTIEFTNGISVEVRPASFRKLRGPTYVGVICDELAFWYQ